MITKNSLTYPDKAQRHDIYKNALKSYQHKITLGGIACLCGIIAKEYELYLTISVDEEFIPRLFPEFKSFKPKNLKNGDLWWGLYEYDTRIEVLNRCIEMTKPQEDELQSNA